VSEDGKARDLFVSLLGTMRNQMSGALSLVEDGAARSDAFEQLGFVSAAPVPDLSAAQAALATLDRQLGNEAGFAAVAEALVAFSLALAEVVSAPDAGTAAEDIVYGIVQLYATTSIRVRHPAVWALLRALGFVGDLGFSFANLAHFISDTGAYLDGIMHASSDEKTADNWSLLLGAGFGALAMIFPKKEGQAFDVQVLYGWEPDPASTHPNADAVLQRMVSVQARLTQGEAKDGKTKTEEKLILTSAVVPPAHGGWGVFGAVSGAAAWTIPFGDFWELKLEGALTDGVDFFISDNHSFFHAGAAIDAGIKATFRRSDNAKGVANIGSADSTHVEFDKLALTGTLAMSGSSIVLQTKGMALVIDSGSADGFLSSVLPRRIRLESDLGIGLDSKRGFYIDGGTKLEATIPINKSVLGLQIQQITLGLDVHADGGGAEFAFELSGAFGLSVAGGAFAASVDRIGLRVVTHLGHPGNASLGNVGVEFKPPSGLGISVDAGICKGGGYLFFDPAKGEYAGIADLRIGPVEVKAIGLLSTKLPDGTPGFSLLLVISVEFMTPPQLGFGFGLEGIGGLIGIHHAVNTDALETGLHNHSLDNILFPADPVATAPRILATMRNVFPVTPDRYVFGPLFRIVWPAIPNAPVAITLGIILDVPAPVRIIILGQLHIALPIRQVPLVDIHADLLGVIDFDKGLIAIDISINDSRLAGYALSGDIIIRVQYKGDGGFVFSAGGFNPRFAVPAGLPTIRRLAIDISGSANPRLRLEAYLALTSNTFQIGARLELHAAAGPFAIDGHLGFDALVQWDPKFYFIVEISAGIALSYDGDTLLGISLDFTLSGPAPWDAAGKATLTILFWDVDVHFHAPPASVELVNEVSQALARRESWEGQLPAAGEGIVSLIARDRAGIVVHPLGALTLRQRTAPVGVKLDRLGHAPLQNARRVELGVPAFGPDHVAASGATPVTDRFAPAQFLDMSDDEKLSRPSFEEFRAGMQISPAGEHVGSVIETDVAYETIVLHGPRTLPFHVLRFDHVALFAELGAAGRSQSARESRYAVAANALPHAPLRVRDTTLAAVASAHTLAPAAIAENGAMTFTLASQALKRHLDQHPEDHDRFVLVGAHEVHP